MYDIEIFLYILMYFSLVLWDKSMFSWEGSYTFMLYAAIETLASYETKMFYNHIFHIYTRRGFREHPIQFRPTYKYDPGTDNFDTSTKQRIPSYTDRFSLL